MEVVAEIRGMRLQAKPPPGLPASSAAGRRGQVSRASGRSVAPLTPGLQISCLQNYEKIIFWGAIILFWVVLFCFCLF